MPQSTMDSDDHLQDLTWRLRSIVGDDNVALDEPMSEHTSFRIGGPADLFVTPDDIDELRDVVAACRAAGVPHFVLGCGSDLLVADAGYRGVSVSCRQGLVNVAIDGATRACPGGGRFPRAAGRA